MNITNRVLTLLGMAALALVSSGVFVAPIEAQTCTFCSYFSGKHSFSAITCDETESGCWGCEDEPDGHIGCHAFRHDGECSAGHSECGVAAAIDFDLLLRAVQTQDIEVLRALMYDIDAIGINLARSAVQVEGCSGGAIAHIPATLAFLGEVQEAIDLDAVNQ